MEVMRPKDILDPDKIKSNLQTETIGQEVVVFKSTASTNDVAVEYAKNIENNGLAILAEQQTAGRGRAGNKWISGFGDSILCSVILTESEIAPELISLASAVAVAEAIGKVGACEAKVKWPNDILVSGRKIAGVLLESQSGQKPANYIIGIGINCHQKEFAEQISLTATSIDIESGTVCDRISVVRRLLTSMDHWLEIAKKEPDRIIERWKQLGIQLGHRIKLLYNNKEFTGNCIGIDPQKGLIVQLDSGAVRMFEAASTSIVK